MRDMAARTGSSDSLFNIGGGSPGVALPDESDYYRYVAILARHAAGLWWLVSCTAIVTFLCVGTLPWWLVILFAAEPYALFRRWQLGYREEPVVSGAKVKAKSAQESNASSACGRRRRLHCLSFVKGAPTESIVASFISLDTLLGVSAIELGQRVQSGPSVQIQRQAFLLTFANSSEEDAFFATPAYQAFERMAAPFLLETLVFAFPSSE